MRSKSIGKAKESLMNALTLITLVIFLFPSVWMILTAIRAPAEINAVPPIWLPRNLTMEHFQHAIFGYSGLMKLSLFPRYLRNSLIIASASTFIAVLFGSLSAYSISRFNFKGKDLIFLGILLTRTIPGIALSLPLYLLFMKFNLVDTLQGLIIAYTALNTPFVTWMMEGAFREVPKEIDEAAFVDGSSKWQTFWRIALPLARPGLIASAILIFILSYNEFPIAFVIAASARSRTAPVGLYEFMHEFYIDWGGMCAAGTIMILPIIIFTFIIQKHIVRGLTFGALK